MQSYGLHAAVAAAAEAALSATTTEAKEKIGDRWKAPGRRQGEGTREEKEMKKKKRGRVR